MSTKWRQAGPCLYGVWSAGHVATIVKRSLSCHPAGAEGGQVPNWLSDIEMPEQEIKNCTDESVSSVTRMESQSFTPKQPPFLIPSSRTSSSSSSWHSFSSSGPDFRPVHPDMIRRKLSRVFLEASSLPDRIDLHKLRYLVIKIQGLGVARAAVTERWL